MNNFSIDSIKTLASQASSLVFIRLGKKDEARSQTEPSDKLPETEDRTQEEKTESFTQAFKTEFLKFAKLAVLFNIEPERALFTEAKEDIKDIRDYINKTSDRKDLLHIIESSAQNGIAGLLFAIGAPGYHFFMPIFTPVFIAASVVPAAVKAYKRESNEANPKEMQAAFEAMETRLAEERWEKGEDQGPSKV